jgi:PAS domain S-box-containing protein
MKIGRRLRRKRLETAPNSGGVYDTLLKLFEQTTRNPQEVPAVPLDPYADGSDGRKLLRAFAAMLEQIELSKKDLQDRAERFDLAVQGANDGLWDWDIRTNASYFSPRWKSMLGYADDEIANRFEEWFSRIHPDDREMALATIDDHLKGRSPFYVLEHRLLHKDGTYRWVLTRGASMRDAEGNAYRMSGSHTDITDRKRAEDSLREKEEQYRSIFEATSDGIGINNMQGYVVEVNPAFCKMHGYTREEMIGMHPTTFIHPDSHHLFAEFMSTIDAGGTFQAQAVDVRKDGTPFNVEVHGSSFTYKGEPHTLGVVRDTTEHVQAYQLLEQRVEERTRELSTLLEVSSNVASTLDLEPLLVLILDQLKLVAEYSGAAALMLDGDRLVLLESRGADTREEELLGREFPVNEVLPIWEKLLRREPVIIPDVLGDTPLAAVYRHAVGDLLYTNFSYIRSWLAVPLTLKEGVVGMLSLSYHEPDYYTPRHATLAMAIGNYAAVAIDNIRLYEQAKETARNTAALEERQRLARELHDSVSQAIFSISLHARTAHTLLQRDVTKVSEPVEHILSLSQAAMAEMRALIFELRPESLENEGLVAAITKQVASTRARHGIDVATQLCDEPELPLEIKEAVYRIAQEGLHNTVKHARATRVDMFLRCSDGALELDIRDNGVGFDSSGSFPGHLGLNSMRERAARVDGTLDIDSAPGSGTNIRLRVPLQAASGEA